MRHPHPGVLAAAIAQQMADTTVRPLNGFDAIAELRGDAAKEFASYTEWWDFIESWVMLGDAIRNVVHLSRYQCHDEDEMWCSPRSPTSQTRDIADATCPECLEAAMRYGFRCALRRAEVAGYDGSGRSEFLATWKP